MSGTSTFELPHYVTDFQEIWRWWIYITSYKSAFHFCPYQFTSQTGLTLKFLHTHTQNKSLEHLFVWFRFNKIHKNYFAQLTHLKTIQS
jgi:hypothetical protein